MKFTPNPETIAWLQSLGIDTQYARKVEIVFEAGYAVTITVHNFADDVKLLAAPPSELIDAPIVYRSDNGHSQ